MVFDKYIDNSPTDEEFAALPHIIENMNNEPREKVNVRIRYTECSFVILLQYTGIPYSSTPGSYSDVSIAASG